jgi:hypothetical protein
MSWRKPNEMEMVCQLRGCIDRVFDAFLAFPHTSSLREDL